MSDLPNQKAFDKLTSRFENSLDQLESTRKAIMSRFHASEEAEDNENSL